VRNIGAVLRQWHLYHIFLDQRYQQHTIARLAHLDSLGLALRSKRVIEVGAGIGEHTLFYLHRGCQVVVTDGRPELVRFVHNRFGIPAYVLDVETQMARLTSLGHFDIAHCYGLLYHLANPEAFLRDIAPLADWLLLETCVSFEQGETLTVFPEDRRRIWQAVHGKGCYPSRAWVFRTLQRFYPYVYCPITQPCHGQFPIDWNPERFQPTTLTRAIFVASHQPIHSALLVAYLPERYAGCAGMRLK
jgi:SAM-dependent methyltransferase